MKKYCITDLPIIPLIYWSTHLSSIQSDTISDMIIIDHDDLTSEYQVFPVRGQLCRIAKRLKDYSFPQSATSQQLRRGMVMEELRLSKQCACRPAATWNWSSEAGVRMGIIPLRPINVPKCT